MYYKFDIKPLAGDDTRRLVDYYEKSLNNQVNAYLGRSSRVLYLHRPYSAGLDGIALNYHWASPNIQNAVDLVKDHRDAFKLIRKLSLTHIIIDKNIAESSPSPFSRSVPFIASLKSQVGSAQLWELDPKILPSDFLMKMNESYVNNFLSSGWREIEPWGVWAYGSIARLSFKLQSRNLNGPIRVKALAMPYFPEGRDGPFKFIISVNGQSLQEFSLLPEQQQQEINFLVPASLINSNGIMEVEFQFKEFFDYSQLQLGFSEISLNYN